MCKPNIPPGFFFFSQPDLCARSPFLAALDIEPRFSGGFAAAMIVLSFSRFDEGGKKVGVALERVDRDFLLFQIKLKK
jgi:hypothetical protein